MDWFAMNRALVGWTVGLALTGGLAAALLVAPPALGYLVAGPMAGDAKITQTSAPLLQVHFVPPKTALLHVLRDGKPVELVLHIDPDCTPRSGWV
jgi:hypothetical protein